MLRRALFYGLPALALFICVWVTRVFLATDIATRLLQLTGLQAIASVAVIGGLLPSLVLGIAYGMIRAQPVVRNAFIVALAACAFELAIASLSVPWWLFMTWWVLPIECVIVLVAFPVASWLGAILFARADPEARRRIGIAVFVVVLAAAVLWAWLSG